MKVVDEWLSQKEIVCKNPACGSKMRRHIKVFEDGVAEYKCEVCKCIHRLYPDGRIELEPTPETPKEMYFAGLGRVV